MPGESDPREKPTPAAPAKRASGFYPSYAKEQKALSLDEVRKARRKGTWRRRDEHQRKREVRLFVGFVLVPFIVLLIAVLGPRVAPGAFGLLTSLLTGH